MAASRGTAAGVHVVAKPVGPACNLNCAYCFYLEKEALFGVRRSRRMSDEVLSSFIANYIASQPAGPVEFVWQGGEPTLAGIPFFERVVALQRPFARTRTITNALQTNGTLLTDDWCAFLKAHGFLVGLSLDGPREIHDRYRVDRGGRGTFDRVIRGLRLLQKHNVDYNVLAAVARDTARRPLDVYRFLRTEGVEFIQFNPIVERLADEPDATCGLRLAKPARLDQEPDRVDLAPWAVVPDEYGDFLIALYEEWVRRDVGRVFVMNFEWALNAWIGNPVPVCVHAEECGRALVVEQDGDVYACDHCVYPEYRLGNVATQGLAALADDSQRSGFGVVKDGALPSQCRECDVLPACRGGCPKHRFLTSAVGDPGLQYLCAGYRKFFRYIRKYLRAMALLLENDLPASHVMDAIRSPIVIPLAAVGRRNPASERTVAKNERAVAKGEGAVAEDERAVAKGEGAVAKDERAVAKGEGAVAKEVERPS